MRNHENIFPNEVVVTLGIIFPIYDTVYRLGGAFPEKLLRSINSINSNDFQSAHQAVSLNSGESTKCTGVLLATARVNALGPNGTKILVLALIDPGSHISLVTQAMCNLLSLNSRTSHTHIQDIG